MTMNSEKVASLKTASLTSKTATARQPHSQERVLQKRNESSLLQLQGKLDVTILVTQYHSWLNSIQRADSVEYTHRDDNLSLSVGDQKQHKAHYTLRLEENYLGTIIISSQKRFTDQDLFDHEQSMAVLVHYLKVAISFRTIERTALHDSLTGVKNRASLDNLLPMETHRAQRYHCDLSIMIIDVDHFKLINDSIGHLGGDKILCRVASIITQSLRSSDLTFRFGGDEFIVLLPNTNLKGAHTAAASILASLGSEGAGSFEHAIKPQLSIGVAALRRGESQEDFLRRADNALYNAKANGRNCIC